MTDQLPQYYKNDLVLLQVQDESALRDTLHALQAAIRKGIDIIISECPGPETDKDASYGSIFTGHLGILYFLFTF